ncbi:HEAT repeat domain-containing protein [Vitiosangium sp. GDMCC 1.1324]|uniref:HEAT repeat domain-containing protein n=1 Tax=Vitiosangium sp. (strain GDMCC 1.1324) TaxID=2138576 RepID=UPI000D37F90F|nr:HEAT repeat domain-containing protein [Vitiosangium sp. GDMCC 1.1324]PTL85929.1 PBS lyase [Vitiosangium sp. GDMCC 1.1324]
MSGRGVRVLVLVAAVALGGLARASPAPLRSTDALAARENEAYARGLLAALEDADDEVVAHALLSLAGAVDVVPGVRERLQAFVREPRVQQALSAGKERLWQASLVTLGTLGTATPDMAPHLMDLLEESDPDRTGIALTNLQGRREALRERELARDAAMVALGNMGEAAREQLPRLVDLALKGDWAGEAALSVLEHMGEAARAQCPRLGQLLKEKDPKVRERAAEILGTLGAAAREQAPLLIEVLLTDPNEKVREKAAWALGAQGEAAKEHVPRLAALLKDPHWHVRERAARALGELGEVAKEHVPRLASRLKDPDARVRAQAARALGEMGEAAKEYVPRLAGLLKDPDLRVRKAAMISLGLLGEADRKDVSRLIGQMLGSPVPVVRLLAVDALGQMGRAAESYVPRLADMLLREQDLVISMTLEQALGNIDAANPEQLPRIVRLLEAHDPITRAAAALSLGSMGEAAREQAPRLAGLLKDSDPEVRKAAAKALGQVGAREWAPQLAGMLEDPDLKVRLEVLKALGQLGAREQASRAILTIEDANRSSKSWEEFQLGAEWQALAGMTPLALEDVALLLALKVDEPEEHGKWLARAHGLGGGEPQVERVLRWLGWRPDSQLPRELPIQEARETLRDFAALWPHTGKYPALREDLAQRISQVVLLGRSGWTQEDVPLLRVHQENLGSEHALQAANVLAVIDSLGIAREPARKRKSVVPELVAWSVAGHVGFWLLLLFFYPRSAKVQAVFFWNPWVRKLLGFGYVGLLLTWVPFLRRRLLAPFRSLLLAEAGLKHFSPQGYFGRTEVRDVSTGKRDPLLEAIPRLKGQVVLEGASGLGKSIFIQYLLCRSKALAVYLPAKDCKQGVLEAIQAKLEGLARDTGFLQSLIYSGALDIYIDGLNEVAADTRARVVQFVEPKFHGNILLATQRMEWTPPATARRYELQPLTEQQVAEFLRGREPQPGEEAKRRGEAYRETCERFLEQALGPPGQTKEERRAMLEVLSNPMDLTVVAQMLAAGHTPDLFRLLQQQYELMAGAYRGEFREAFPLEKLSEEAYQMRLEDRRAIPEEEFRKELPMMEKEDFKMVVRQEWQGAGGSGWREWHFRHEKLQDFFIVQTFLGETNPRVAEHLDDPRFRGVYAQLAKVLEPWRAQELREHLVAHAARTHDHTVSDEFVTLLKERRLREEPPSHGDHPGGP